jgi:hypothetical protein
MCSAAGIDSEIHNGICERCGIEDVRHGILEDDDDLYLVNSTGGGETTPIYGTPTVVRQSERKNFGTSFGDLYEENKPAAKSTLTLEEALEEAELR